MKRPKKYPNLAFVRVEKERDGEYLVVAASPQEIADIAETPREVAIYRFVRVAKVITGVRVE